jgi:hypothetical protein
MEGAEAPGGEAMYAAVRLSEQTRALVLKTRRELCRPEAIFGRAADARGGGRD